MIRSVTIAIPVTDLPKAVAWYRALLGDRPELDPTTKIKEFELLDNVWLQLVEVSPEQRFSPIIRIGVEDVKQAHKSVTHLGAQPPPIAEVPNLVHYFEFQDPYENNLFYYELL